MTYVIKTTVKDLNYYVKKGTTELQGLADNATQFPTRVPAFTYLKKIKRQFGKKYNLTVNRIDKHTLKVLD